MTKVAFTLFSTTSACFTSIPMGSGRKVDRIGDFLKTMLLAFLWSYWSAFKCFKRFFFCYFFFFISGDSSGNKQDKNRGPVKEKVFFRKKIREDSLFFFICRCLICNRKLQKPRIASCERKGAMLYFNLTSHGSRNCLHESVIVS